MSILFLKGSFEDECLRPFETKILSAISAEKNIPLAFKIGGCEAKTDIESAINYGAHCIVAPMIESEYAAKKFISATKPWEKFIKERNINIETITAVNNIEKILEKNHKYIDGIVVGRTDLALSMGLSKSMVDSKVVMKYVEDALRCAKKYDLITTMGGSVNMRSTGCIMDMNNKGILDRFETRKVIMESSSSEEEIHNKVKNAFEIEVAFLERTVINYRVGLSASLGRIRAIDERG